MSRPRLTVARMLLVVAAWGLACAGLAALGPRGEVKLATLLACLFIALNLGLAMLGVMRRLERRGE